MWLKKQKETKETLKKKEPRAFWLEKKKSPSPLSMPLGSGARVRKKRSWGPNRPEFGKRELEKERRPVRRS